MYYVENNHPAIIPRDVFRRVQEEMTRRASKRKVMQKSGKTEQGKYSARYALSELLVCGECGTPYRRCTWARNGQKRIVWRCISRLEFGARYCHHSPTLDESRVQAAVLAALNRYAGCRDAVMEQLARDIQTATECHDGNGQEVFRLREQLRELSAEQEQMLDRVLEDMDNAELNERLGVLSGQKAAVMARLDEVQRTAEQDETRQARLREVKERLGQMPLQLTGYDDAAVRRLVERVTVVDEDTIRVRIKGLDMEFEQKL